MHHPPLSPVHRRARRPPLDPDLVIIDGPVDRLAVAEQEAAPPEYPLLLLVGAQPVYLGLQGPALGLQPDHIFPQLAHLVLLDQDFTFRRATARGLKVWAWARGPAEGVVTPLAHSVEFGLL